MITSEKRVAANTGNTIGNVDAGQFITELECRRANAGYAVGQGNAYQIVAIIKGGFANTDDTLADRYFFQLCGMKCMIANACYTIWNCDICKAIAISKCIIADACSTVGNCNAHQVAATIKCVIADACQIAILLKSDTCQALEVIERILADFGNFIGDYQMSN